MMFYDVLQRKSDWIDKILVFFWPSWRKFDSHVTSLCLISEKKINLIQNKNIMSYLSAIKIFYINLKNLFWLLYVEIEVKIKSI